jgi:hypothetical protein
MDSMMKKKAFSVNDKDYFSTVVRLGIAENFKVSNSWINILKQCHCKAYKMVSKANESINYKEVE